MGIAQFQRIVFIVFCCNFLQHIIAHQIQRRDIFQYYRMPAYGKTIYVCIAFYLIALHCIALYCIVHCTVYTYSSQGTGGEWDMAVTVRNPLYGQLKSKYSPNPSDAIGTFSILFVHVHLEAQFRRRIL